jgi:uncharacterized protein
VIIINIEIDAENIVKSLIVEGHSGFNTKGKDIVCAGVSVLILTFGLTIQQLSEIDFKLIDGKEYVIKINGFKKEIADELIGISIFLITGLKAVAEKYKNNVKLNILRS